MNEIRMIDHLTDDILREIVNRIIAAVDPDKVILFGSYAYGEPQRQSDLDILVIKKTDLPRHKRCIPVYDALRGLIIPKDIVVYTPEEVEDWENVPQSFLTSIIRKGRLLYERQA